MWSGRQLWREIEKRWDGGAVRQRDECQTSGRRQIMPCLPRVPVWVGLTLTGPAHCLQEPKEEKGRQEEADAILQRGARETWQA